MHLAQTLCAEDGASRACLDGDGLRTAHCFEDEYQRVGVLQVLGQSEVHLMITNIAPCRQHFRYIA